MTLVSSSWLTITIDDFRMPRSCFTIAFITMALDHYKLRAITFGHVCMLGLHFKAENASDLINGPCFYIFSIRVSFLVVLLGHIMYLFVAFRLRLSFTKMIHEALSDITNCIKRSMPTGDLRILDLQRNSIARCWMCFWRLEWIWWWTMDDWRGTLTTTIILRRATFCSFKLGSRKK